MAESQKIDLRYQTLDLRGKILNRAELSSVLPRPEVDVQVALSAVEPIISAVKARGVAAVHEYSKRFDGISPENIRVPAEALKNALRDLDPEIKYALELAISRVKQVSEASLPVGKQVLLADGAMVEEKFLPVQRVGLYVPGGRAVLPSSVVMNVVPAQAAGVSEIVLASPPQAEFGGLPHPTILAACQMLGVKEVYAAGGAQAIALLAHGDQVAEDPSERVQPVDMITGPGNVFVAAAKRAVKGLVGIDSEAGPTEIAIIADSSANPRYVAADLISQAEHDPMAASVLITDSSEFAEQVETELAVQVAQTEHSKRVITALNGAQSRIVLVDDLKAMIEVANAYGAEHLEIQTSSPEQVASQITNAGAVFLGAYSPVSLGDYAAGSNHVLPTGGSSKFSAGLSVHTFLKPMAFINYDRAALENSRIAVETLAEAEGLPAHGRAVSIRFE